ncbi:AzlC family ABC transporter permease [Dehalobacterium formicoaceticum]|uniref:AzlC family ABC transporter permease n=1 Tax=Dehalobacterium formicoaceticum TaxID=51515 RepID=A0ABT1Y6H5_9FIRM|nr:AzlC family ABC transporter permease [Dehalobacterium formicoaceticum]MCR6545291.1 AzlC family ABC transporter permease [Dehalobacterium formicoaceticum]
MQVQIDQVKLGVKKAMPIGMGYLPLGLAFGVIAQSAGLSPVQVGLMSLFLFSGSGQFIAVALMAAGAGFNVIILTVLLVNSRYFLFSATLSRYVKKLPLWCTALISQGLTDENFVVVTTHFRDHPVRVDFWLSLHITSHLVWVSSTVLGSVVGNFIPDMERFGLNFALPAMFIALFFMTASNLKGIFCGVVAGILSLVILYGGFSDVNVILATIIAATVGVVINKWIPGS